MKARFCPLVLRVPPAVLGMNDPGVDTCLNSGWKKLG